MAGRRLLDQVECGHPQTSPEHDVLCVTCVDSVGYSSVKVLTFQEVFYIYLYDHKWRQRAVESNFLCHVHSHQRHILSGLSLSNSILSSK